MGVPPAGSSLKLAPTPFLVARQTRPNNRFMCCIFRTLQWHQMGCLGDSSSSVAFDPYADADLAGDSSKKPTAGAHRMRIQVPGRTGRVKRQSFVSHRMLEAEVVAADAAIRSEGIPSLDLRAVGPLDMARGSSTTRTRPWSRCAVRELDDAHTFAFSC